MNKFEDYAKRIVEKLPKTISYSEVNGDDLSSIWNRHSKIAGSLQFIEYGSSRILVPAFKSEDSAGDKIIANIMDELLNDDDNEAIIRGVWENGIESMAFYKSYHFLNQQPYPGKWGIFIYSFGINSIAKEIEHFYLGRFSKIDCGKKALQFLHRHERFHWFIDAWTMAHEAIQDVPLYENYINKIYRHNFPHHTFEEALANNHALKSLQHSGIATAAHLIDIKEVGDH